MGSFSGEGTTQQRVVDLSTFTGAGLDRGRSKGVEALWWIAKLTIVQSRIPWPSAIRRMALRAFGAKIGKGFYIRPSVNIHFPWKLTIGDNVWIGEGCTILNLEPVEIHSNVALAHEVYVSTGNHNIFDQNFSYKNGPVIIHSGAWLASRCFVGSGTTVGEGAVVAAGAVVVQDVLPWTIVGGVPATAIGHRTIQETFS